MYMADVAYRIERLPPPGGLRADLERGLPRQFSRQLPPGDSPWACEALKPEFRPRTMTLAEILEPLHGGRTCHLLLLTPTPRNCSGRTTPSMPSPSSSPQAVLEAAVDIESLQAGKTALEAGPIPKLQPDWVGAIRDDTPEVRLALSIGSAAAGFEKDGRPFDPVRHHWLPLERGARRFQLSDGRLVNDARVIMFGRDPVADLAAIVARRLLEAQRDSRRVLPLRSARGCSARLADLAALIDGHVDLSRVLTLGRALMALDWSTWGADMPPASGQTNIRMKRGSSCVWRACRGRSTKGCRFPPKPRWSAACCPATEPVP